MTTHAAAVITPKGLADIISLLWDQGRRVKGPTIKDGSLVYADIKGVDRLPRGWSEEREAGVFRISQTDGPALFGYSLGQDSFKRYLHPPRLTLSKMQRTKSGFAVRAQTDQQAPLALLGVRPCELAAIGIQDKVFIERPYPDKHYTAQRSQTLIIAVNCTKPGGTCFCASMSTGPGAKEGFDLALTEVVEPDRHYFVVEAGSAAGAGLLEQVEHQPAGVEKETARRLVSEAAGRMGRSLETEGIKDLLYANREHPHWQTTATRCLACGNCTLVCPTCFCHTLYDGQDLDGRSAWRARRWDTCFSPDFSYIHGGSVRTSPWARYRQWVSHKLAAWQDQFGVVGCVGCGRCITWCPVGMDITREVGMLRQSGHTGQEPQPGHGVDHG